MTLDIAFVQSPEEIEMCLALRRAVFIDEQGVSEEEEIDGQDDRCAHLLVRRDGAPVGAARVQVKGDVAKIQRVCVAREGRGLGIGARLIGFIIDHLAAEGRVTLARLDAQTASLDFYRKLGFEAEGAEFLDAEIPHRSMKRRLPG
ncbi:MAG: GNAT family N-acetyltransferase [Alphaproteobacteria bacterium]|nr:GNAT family N-acetyltransferase [Alphaproteobacteria bacterium]